jgi:hypothetical protein
MHEGALVYLGANERAIVRASQSGVRPKIVQIKLLKYSGTVCISHLGISCEAVKDGAQEIKCWYKWKNAISQRQAGVRM